MYNRIINPETGRSVKITSRIGKRVLRNYARQIGGGCVNCEPNRGPKKRCRNIDKKAGCEYIKKADIEKRGVDEYGCYKC